MRICKSSFNFNKNFFVFLFAFGVSVISVGQTHKSDSLQKILTAYVSADTGKLVLLNKLSYELEETGNYLQAIKYAGQAVELAKTLMAQSKSEKEKNNISLLLSDSYTNLGLVYNSLANFPEALKSHLAALKIRESLNDARGKANSYMNIGITYRRNRDTQNALKYYLMALKIQEELKDVKNMAGSLHNLGVIYLTNGDYNRALENFKTSLEMNIKTGNKSWMANNYMGLGYVYDDKGEYEEALKNYFLSLEITIQIGSKSGTAMVYDNLAAVYVKQKKYREARKSSEKSLALSLETASRDLAISAYWSLANLDSIEGNAKGALNNYKLYIAYKDSVNNEANTKDMVRSQMNYEFDKKEAATRLEQEKKEAVALADSKKQRIIIWSVSGILLLVLAFAFFAYRSYIEKKKANVAISYQKKIIEEKQKEILDSIYYARKIQRSLLTNARYIDRTLNRLKA